MFVFLVVFVFVILVDRRPSLFGFETGGFDFCLWLLLSKATVFAFLMGNGFGTLGTDLYFLCSYINGTPQNGKRTSSLWIWIWAIWETADTMVDTPLDFSTCLSQFVANSSIWLEIMIFIHILLLINRCFMRWLIYNRFPLTIMRSNIRKSRFALDSI